MKLNGNMNRIDMIIVELILNLMILSCIGRLKKLDDDDDDDEYYVVKVFTVLLVFLIFIFWFCEIGYRNGLHCVMLGSAVKILIYAKSDLCLSKFYQN